MNPSVERLLAGQACAREEREHRARYAYAQAFAPGMRVLDLACGSGYGSHLLAQSGANSVLGVDLSAEAVAHCRAEYQAPNLQFVRADAAHLAEVPDRCFDLVVSFETLEHLPNAKAFVREIQRVLKPGGMLIMSTPDRRLNTRFYPWRRTPSNPYHVREFVRSEIAELLSGGFAVQEWLGQGFIPRWLACWPVVISLKSVGHFFARLGGARLSDRLYHSESGIAVQSLADAGRWRTPTFWIVRATKR